MWYLRFVRFHRTDISTSTAEVWVLSFHCWNVYVGHEIWLDSIKFKLTRLNFLDNLIGLERQAMIFVSALRWMSTHSYLWFWLPSSQMTYELDLGPESYWDWRRSPLEKVETYDLLMLRGSLIRDVQVRFYMYYLARQGTDLVLLRI